MKTLKIVQKVLHIYGLHGGPENLYKLFLLCTSLNAEQEIEDARISGWNACNLMPITCDIYRIWTISTARLLHFHYFDSKIIALVLAILRVIRCIWPTLRFLH